MAYDDLVSVIYKHFINSFFYDYYSVNVKSGLPLKTSRRDERDKDLNSMRIDLIKDRSYVTLL